ncbi:MAG TPA: acyl-CoA thioesterase [Cyclobacteriaceae bacterium]
MYKTEIKIRVRYAETDQMGYVYYGNYATYYEVARVEALRKLGFHYKKLEEQGIMLPVISLECNFIKPAKYDELLSIQISLVEMPSVKMKFEYEIRNENDVLLNTGKTTLVFINQTANRPTRIPREMYNGLIEYFQ